MIKAIGAMHALALVLLLSFSAVAQTSEPAWLLTLNGAVGPASTDFIRSGLEAAVTADSPLVILLIDTPGGLDSSMRDIIAAILASPVPVACLVAPAGARAASAGTYILYSCHIAAMAPATHLGAATPVRVGAAEAGDSGKSATERKMLNDAVAYIRGLAELRGRNAEWAEQAVREAATLSARQALEQNAIDMIAASPAALLEALDGHEVRVGEAVRTLDTASLRLKPLEPGWRHRFLATITNPNIAYILLLIGIYGLLLEFYNPGALLPGITGAISLLVALYAFQVLPVSYVGLGLILVGIGLLVAEALAPSVGLLGAGGVVAFVIGSVMLMDRGIPGYRIALPLILSLSVAITAATLAIVGIALRARRQPATGINVMVGVTAVAQEDFEHEGWVRLQGELWRARTETPVRSGELLTVNATDGLIVAVEPRHENSGQADTPRKRNGTSGRDSRRTTDEKNL